MVVQTLEKVQRKREKMGVGKVKNIKLKNVEVYCPWKLERLGEVERKGGRTGSKRGREKGEREGERERRREEKIE